MGGLATAFAALGRVRNGDYSKWQIVYDTKRLAVHFKMLGEGHVRTVHLPRARPTCKQHPTMLDLADAGSGEVTATMRRWTPEANRKLIRATLGSLKRGGRFPPAAIAAVAALPGTSTCDAKALTGQARTSLRLNSAVPSAP